MLSSTRNEPGPSRRRVGRTVAISAPVAELLRARRTAQKRERLAHPGPTVDRCLVFSEPGGDPPIGTTLTKRFQRRLEALGIADERRAAEFKRGRFHDLRHTAVSLMSARGDIIRPGHRVQNPDRLLEGHQFIREGPE